MKTKTNATIKDSKTGKVLQVLKGRTEAEIAAVVTCLSKHFNLSVVRN